jgi:hypothetical protein
MMRISRISNVVLLRLVGELGHDFAKKFDSYVFTIENLHSYGNFMRNLG